MRGLSAGESQRGYRMRSGHPSMMDYNYFTVRLEFDSIDDTNFKQFAFNPRPALVNKEGGDCYPYGGEEYDKARFDVKDEMWEHEHCDICGFSIDANYTYWANNGRVNILCDECYDHFVQHNKTMRAKPPKEGMIINWLKRRRMAAIQEKEQGRAAAIEEQQKAIDQWGKEYFSHIAFPIVIFSNKGGYLAVSTLAEYYYDTDINVWFVKPDCELVDSMGQKFNFAQIPNTRHWVPHENTGTIEYEELKARLMPLLYMPDHKKGISSTKTIKDIIELIIIE
jgi:hypothetical protein